MLITAHSDVLLCLNTKTLVSNLLGKGLDSTNAFNLERILVKTICKLLSNMF